MTTVGACEYCQSEGSGEFADNGADKVYVCTMCQKLLSTPSTALRLMRGHMTLRLRGTMPSIRLKRLVDAFIEQLSKMGPKVP